MLTEACLLPCKEKKPLKHLVITRKASLYYKINVIQAK